MFACMFVLRLFTIFCGACGAGPFESDSATFKSLRLWLKKYRAENDEATHRGKHCHTYIMHKSKLHVHAFIHSQIHAHIYAMHITYIILTV